MLPSTRVVFQNLLETGNDGRLDVTFVKMSSLDEDHADLRTLVERNEGRHLGLSAVYMPNLSLAILAIADATSVFLIDFTKDKNNGRGSPPSPPSPSEPTSGRDYLSDHVLGRTSGFVCAFDMGPLAVSLWQSHDLRIRQAIDLQSAGPSNTRAPRATIKSATAGQDGMVKSNNIIRAFDKYICEDSGATALNALVTPLVQRAWVAHYVSQLVSMEDKLHEVPPIDTNKIPDVLLRFLAKSTRDAFQKEQMKPTEVTKPLTAASYDNQKRELHVKSDRYQNKFRKGKNQRVKVHVSAHHGVGAFAVPAEIASAGSEGAYLKTENSLGGKLVSTVTLFGREDPTRAEVKRAQIILSILQGKLGVDGTPWIQKMYLNPEEEFMWPAEWSQPTPTPIRFNADNIPRPLNKSQRKAVKCMLDQTDSSRVTIIQGPPGTGKTTVIASYVLTAVSAGKSGIWLIAQSNVAVKNIAEKLTAFGLTKWKILVSNEFHDFWHEHLYTTIRNNTITSSEFPAGLPDLIGCPVVLCTLSMLSSDMLRFQGAFKKNPVHTLVIDEASQIEIGDYIPLFFSFNTIRKVIFIGDNMQLPPHGQDDIQGLQSVFEIEHLMKQSSTAGPNPFIFLDTQYRMPPQIGDFIAQTVYPSENADAEPLLKSSDKHPLAEERSLLCHFVNVPGEQISQGTSWKNLQECEAIIKLASIFEAQKRDFRIITPYDAQRSLIEGELKKAELEWGDKCFNVDSFQGNEEDYIIISIVRSRDLGFLEDKRRVNVMLSRCKKGMIIFTSKAYIDRYAGPEKTLIGGLISHWYNDEAWIEVGDLDKDRFV